MVLKHFRDGHMTPSQIDALMKLPKGTAHLQIVAWWAEVRKGHES